MRAKCKMIPKHLIFFCQQLYLECSSKYNEDLKLQLVVPHFLFEEWLLKILCEEVDKHGLTPYAHFEDTIRKNLVIVRIAINSLFLLDKQFEHSQNALPPEIANVCESRRK